MRRNAEIIIKNATAYPFRVNLKSLRCVYCADLFDDPDLFRAHMTDEHQTFTLAMAFAKLPKTEPLKADITDLECRLCSLKRNSLKDIAEHLKDVHGKPVNFNTELGIMPYLLQKDIWKCAVCDKSLPSLLHLNKHTITHFQSHCCEICGKSYKAATGLVQHVRAKHDEENKALCRRCQTVFPSMEAKAVHQRTAKRCMLHCCLECPERFPSWEMKQKHMIEVHGMQKKTYRCTNCDWVCEDRRAFYDHFKLRHSQDCLLCIHCGLKFATPSRLSRHLEKHVT